MAELLGADSTNCGGEVWASISLAFGSTKRCQELNVEIARIANQVIANHGRMALTGHVLCKPSRHKSCANVTSCRCRVEWYRDVGIAGHQWRVLDRPGKRMQSVQTVCPSSDNNHPGEPRAKGLDETDERYRVGRPRRHRDPANSGRSARRSISSACARPRAGWSATSSHTCRMSETKRSPRRTAARKTACGAEGILTYTSGGSPGSARIKPKRRARSDPKCTT